MNSERARSEAPLRSAILISARQGNGTAAASPVREEPSPEPPARSGKKVLLLLGASLVLSVGIVWGVHAWQFGATHISTDDAYLTSDTVPITPQVAGNVARVLVKDNQRVRAGQPLVILDDATFRVDVDQAEANLDVAQATAEGSATNVGLTSFVNWAALSASRCWRPWSTGALTFTMLAW